ncbi:MAG: hypothetical protein ABSH09_26240 [Bryobacteraceae bacterium]
MNSDNPLVDSMSSGSADARLRIPAPFIQRLFAENPDFVDECVPATVSVNKLARDNRRLVIRNESYDLDA